MISPEWVTSFGINKLATSHARGTIFINSLGDWVKAVNIMSSPMVLCGSWTSNRGFGGSRE